MPKKNIAIIGAGLSGAILYNNLKKKNYNVTIFEKSRGAGGRCSTRYIKDLKIDHGTSTFQVQDESFENFCDDQVRSQLLIKAEDGYKGTNGLNKMVSSLISYEDLQTRTKLIKAYKNDSRWVLEDENKNLYGGFDTLLCTIPATQVLDLQIENIKSIQSKLQNVTYDAVATLITYGATLEKEQIQQLQKNSFFRKISVQNDGIVFHVIAQISNKLDSKEEVQNIIVHEIKTTIGVDILATMNVIPHLWRYGFVLNSLDTNYIYDKELRFGLCGDYFQGDNLEASFLSSSSLATQIS